jgi:spermidine synthase
MKRQQIILLSSLLFVSLVSIKLEAEIVTLGDKQYFKEAPAPDGVLHTEYLYEIKEQLYSGKSDFQKIEVLQTADYGNMLVLDGMIQTTEKDEFTYHENLCHLPMFYHPNSQKILIIGGGDGGAIEEILKHPVQEVYMVDIDEKVTEISKKYLPTLSNGAFDNEKVKLIIGDGKEFIKNHKDSFDVIILDLPDPDGPAADLITEDFYKDVKSALRKDGIISVQGESLTVQPDLAAKIISRLKNVFSFVKVHTAMVPTYQSSIFSFPVASDFDLDKVTLEQVEKKYKELNLDLKYYHPAIHFSSAVLPIYLEKLITLRQGFGS